MRHLGFDQSLEHSPVMVNWHQGQKRCILLGDFLLSAILET